MHPIKVADLMTDEVVSLAPGTAAKEVAKVLAQYDISGAPVLDDEDRVLGVVSQTDVLALTSPGPPAQGTVRTASLTVGEIMSAPAVTVHAEETAADAARLMTRRGIERLPVVDVEERLVGIITRRDLLRLFLRPDAEIRRRVHEVLTDVLGVPAGNVDVHVVDGIVTLNGRVPQESQLGPLLGLVERIDGVVAVASHLTALSDDTADAGAGGGRSAMPW
ncbi:CBS domain-containing protein [Streptomyces sp. NPDC029216]|uniref:CBS domain-containing protein n=1 Tax=Streptomyces sp. NPDC029216 TaxID=3154701 RepID=UPI0033DB004D